VNLKRFSIVILIVVLLLIGGRTFADKENKTVYLVVANRLTLDDIKTMYNLNDIIRDGSIGLMNPRGLSGYNGAESYLTINASNRAFTDYDGGESYNLNDYYKKLYEKRVGETVGDEDIGIVGFSKLIKYNEDNYYKPYIGALGDSFHKAGLKTALYGNADILDRIIRPSSLIPMDSKGLIDYGNIDNIIVDDDEFPYGFRTDYEKMLKQAVDIREKASLVVIDTGDLDRLASYSNELTDKQYFNIRNKILNNIDEFLKELSHSLDRKNSLVIIISPNGGEERVNGSILSPVIFWGGGMPKGVLSSSTTKREGLISNIDIAPTIINYLGLPHEQFLGTNVYSINRDNGFEFLYEDNNRINVVSNSRFYVLAVYSILSIISCILGTLLVVFNVKISGKISKIFWGFIILAGSIPFVLLINSAVNWNNYFQFILSLIVILSITFIILYNINNKSKKNILYISSLVIYLTLVIDMLTNNNLIRFSPLGYDPIIGARYFGIGNEMVGVFMGCMIILLCNMEVFKKSKNKNRIILYLISFLTVFLIGSPKFGAKVGGTICVLFAVLVFILEDLNIRINFKSMVLICSLVVVAILGFSYIDIKFNSNPTHLGKTILMASSQGEDLINNIIIRKILMNIKLIGSSVWTKSLYINIVSQSCILIFCEDKIREMFNKRKNICIGLISGIAGSIMGILVNDSGIILSALSMVLLTSYFLSITAEELN